MICWGQTRGVFGVNPSETSAKREKQGRTRAKEACPPLHGDDLLSILREGQPPRTTLQAFRHDDRFPKCLDLRSINYLTTQHYRFGQDLNETPGSTCDISHDFGIGWAYRRRISSLHPRDRTELASPVSMIDHFSSNALWPEPRAIKLMGLSSEETLELGWLFQNERLAALLWGR